MADIANASAEQATGIDQINKALSQMDEVTQQNSALVEENAATAKTLEHQSHALDGRVAVFQLELGAPVGCGCARAESGCGPQARAGPPRHRTPDAVGARDGGQAGRGVLRFRK